MYTIRFSVSTGLCIAAMMAVPLTAETDTTVTRKVLEISVDRQGDLDDALDDVKDAISDVKEELQDKIDDVNERVKDVSDDLLDKIDDCKEERADSPDHLGGSGIISVQFQWIDTDPIRALARAENSLKGKEFDFDNHRPAPVIGFMGFHNQGNGLRIGSGIWCGYKRFQSEFYAAQKIDTVAEDTLSVDSVAILRLIPAQAGFMLEKAFTFNNWSIFAGAMIGGGADVLISQFKEADGNIFVTNQTDYNDSLDEANYQIGATVATYLTWDVHAGATVTLAPALQLGVDGVVLFKYSPEGFGRISGDYLSVNPGLRLRLTFGKNS
jgi:gas vesicle protein